MLPKNPKVSVSIITYNHAKYIRQAIESALMQETTFEYEILIGEDDSSDGTREIVKEYAQKYPDKIRLFLNDRKNVIYIDDRPTGRWNFVNNLKNTRGEYVAILDGDDYWIDPLKLQKQVDSLENNPECVLCFHNVSMENEELNKTEKFNSPPSNQRYGLNDLLRGNLAATSSIMYRNGIITEFPDWYYESPFGDYPLNVMLALNGSLLYLCEVMGVYRIHSQGIYRGKTQIENLEAGLKTRILFGTNLNLLRNSSLRKAISNFYFSLSVLYRSQNDYKLFIKNLIKSFQFAQFNQIHTFIKRFISQQIHNFSKRIENIS